jgi:hypothetical protein
MKEATFYLQLYAGLADQLSEHALNIKEETLLFTTAEKQTSNK